MKRARAGFVRGQGDRGVNGRGQCRSVVELVGQRLVEHELWDRFGRSDRGPVSSSSGPRSKLCQKLHRRPPTPVRGLGGSRSIHLSYEGGGVTRCPQPLTNPSVKRRSAPLPFRARIGHTLSERRPNRTSSGSTGKITPSPCALKRALCLSQVKRRPSQSVSPDARSRLLATRGAPWFDHPPQPRRDPFGRVVARRC